MDTLLIVGLVIGAGWCFFMGPCKGMLDGLLGGGGGAGGSGDQHELYRQSGNDTGVAEAAIQNIMKVNNKTRPQAIAQYNDYLRKI